MVPSLLFDISGFDLDKVQIGPEGIERVNPHRGVMRMLDGIIYAAPTFDQVIAYKDIRDDEFWVPGHVPGRPLFPGVLMIEAAAQMASFMSLCRLNNGGFMGFVGAQDIKFRSQVVPGDRLIMIGKEIDFNRRKWSCDTQGLVRGAMVFEARIIGMPI